MSGIYENDLIITGTDRYFGQNKYASFLHTVKDEHVPGGFRYDVVFISETFSERYEDYFDIDYISITIAIVNMQTGEIHIDEFSEHPIDKSPFYHYVYIWSQKAKRIHQLSCSFIWHSIYSQDGIITMIKYVRDGININISISIYNAQIDILQNELKLLETMLKNPDNIIDKYDIKFKFNVQMRDLINPILRKYYKGKTKKLDRLLDGPNDDFLDMIFTPGLYQ